MVDKVSDGQQHEEEEEEEYGEEEEAWNQTWFLYSIHIKSYKLSK